MAVDGAALATLLTLVLVGPLSYAVYFLLRKVRCCMCCCEPTGVNDKVRSSFTADGVSKEAREEVGTIEYTLGLLGYAIGIGNVWRFPYLVGKYGGGAFVVAYLVCLFLVAMPMYQI